MIELVELHYFGVGNFRNFKRESRLKCRKFPNTNIFRLGEEKGLNFIRKVFVKGIFDFFQQSP